MGRSTHTTPPLHIRSITSVKWKQKLRQPAEEAQEYLPPELLEHSSYAADPDKHILKTPDAELKDKEWDEKRLAEWEKEVNGGAAWTGPFEPEL